MRNIRLLLVTGVIIILTGCGTVQSMIAGASGDLHCNKDKTTCHAQVNYSQAPQNSLQPSASVPGPTAQPSPAQSSPGPTVTVTQTITPPPLPQPTVTTTVYVDISTCYPSPVPDADYLISLKTDPNELASLAACLHVPDPNLLTFEDQVQIYVNIAEESGLFDTDSGRWAFSRGTEKVLCPDGHIIWSLFQIYSTYA